MYGRFCTVFCLAVALAPLVGCSDEAGPKTSRVWGEVAYDGKPVEDGTIEFTASDGSHAAQGTIKAGKYDIAAQAGPIEDKPYKVAISSLSKTGKSTPSLMPGSTEPMEALINTIPREYNSQTILTATASVDKKQFDFKLEKPGDPKKR
jgi:hypothetical protein